MIPFEPRQNGCDFSVFIRKDGRTLKILPKISASQVRTLWLDLPADPELAGQGTCTVTIINHQNPAWVMEKDITL